MCGERIPPVRRNTPRGVKTAAWYSDGAAGDDLQKTK
jgi:hypothetical protein